MMTRLPTRLDRYPAKMVTRLADRLVDRYAVGATRILDPFCGSGAVLVAARRKGIPVSGIDLNPLAGLFTPVKLNGFSGPMASELAGDLVRSAKRTRCRLRIGWPGIHYWFTPRTLEKLERLRAVGRDYDLSASDEGLAVLLSLALAVRPCSRADQRSPKPFISKKARESRRGLHFDPYCTLLSLLQELTELYGAVSARRDFRFLRGDLTSEYSIPVRIGKHSHVITSPPYINAQDYYRNFKLELHVLEGLLPFSVRDLRERFIGTDRGSLLEGIQEEILRENRRVLPSIVILERRNPRLAAVVHRYLYDIARAFANIRRCLRPGGRLVLVCADNLVGGVRIPTSRALRAILEEKGFRVFESFSDRIQGRLLPPKRCGHKGLIKEEVIFAFEMD